MSFSPLKPYQIRNAAYEAAVTLAYNDGASAAEGKRAWRGVTRLNLWPGRMTKVPSWLEVGESVNVEIGDAKDAGYLRISAGGAFKICYAPRGKKNEDGKILCILIAPLPEVRNEKFGPDACEYDVIIEQDKSYMLIDLPEWAYKKRPVAVPGASLAPAQVPLVKTDRSEEYRLGAPSHAAVNKVRGVPGA